MIEIEIVEAAKKLILECMGTKKDEKLLIVTDEKKADIGYNFAVAGRELGLTTTFMETSSQTKGEPPELVAAAMKEADVEFLITSMSYSHTQARIAATENGARIASMPMLTTQIAKRYLNAEYVFIKNVSIGLANMLSRGNRVRVATEKGTDITFDIRGRKGFADTGIFIEPGEFGNLPAGEAFIAPIEDCGTGTIVVDGTIAYVGMLDNNIKFTLENGRIIDIVGEESAKKVKAFLADKDEESNGIAEFGIGTNPIAKIIGHPLVDEKVWGTIHIAFGMNTSMGGTRDSNIHYDCIINEPTVWIDDVMIMEKGKHIY